MIKRVFCIGNGQSRKNYNLEKLRPFGKIYGCNALYRDFTPDVLVAVDHGIMHEIYHSGYCEKKETWFRDWTAVPDYMYNSLVETSISPDELNEIKKYDFIIENKKTDQTEFVMHGVNLKGIVDILRRNKATIDKKYINHSNCYISWIRKTDLTHDLKEIMVNEEGKAIDHGWACGATAGYIAIKQQNPTHVYLIGHDLYSNNDKVNNLYAGSEHYVIPEHSPTPAVNWIVQWKTLAKWNPNINFIKVNEFNDSSNLTNMPIQEWEGIKNLSYMNLETLDKKLGL